MGISPSFSQLKLTVADVSAIPQGLHIYWIDKSVTTDLLTTSEITIPARSEESYVYIVATTETLDLTPRNKNVQLYHAEPNPFRNTTALGFVLPYTWENDGNPDGKKLVNIII